MRSRAGARRSKLLVEGTKETIRNENGHEHMSAIEPLLLTLDAAAEQLSVSTRTVRRLLGAGELIPVKIGRAIRVSTASVHAYVDRATTPSDNRPGAGPDVREKSTCRESARQETRTVSTGEGIRRIGGRATPTQAASELAAALGLPTEGKPRPYSRRGGSNRTGNANGENNRPERSTR